MLRAEVGMRVRCANKASAEWFRRERGIGQIPRKNCKNRGICGCCALRRTIKRKAREQRSSWHAEHEAAQFFSRICWVCFFPLFPFYTILPVVQYSSTIIMFWTESPPSLIQKTDSVDRIDHFWNYYRVWVFKDQSRKVFSRHPHVKMEVAPLRR